MRGSSVDRHRNSGLAFNAHEVLEVAWKHVQRGSHRSSPGVGVLALDETAPYDIDVASLAAGTPSSRARRDRLSAGKFQFLHALLMIFV